MLKALYAAEMILHEQRVFNRDAEMVLFAMLDEGMSFDEALESWAEFSGQRRDDIEDRMNRSCRLTCKANVRYLLERCCEVYEHEN